MLKNAFLLAILSTTFTAHAQTATVPAAPDPVFDQHVEKLFVDGLPDPRGLPYHAVKIAPSPRPFLFFGSLSSPSHLFVLPTEPGAKQLGLSWDGVVYELESVGALVDWRIEARGLLATEPEDFQARRRWASFTAQPVAEVFLWRLGEPEMARALRRQFAKEFEFRGKTALTVWLQNVRTAGISSFAQGNLDAATRQFEILQTRSKSAEATRVLGDIARRRNDLVRPNGEVEGLIWDLQNARAGQFSIPGNISWRQSETVQKLVAAGDKAVPALLDAFENDTRLTRSFRLSRQGFGPADLAPVSDAAKSALEDILNRQYYLPNSRLSREAQNAELLQQMRADWQRLRAFSPSERLYRILLDDWETPEHWSETARALVQRGPKRDFFMTQSTPKNAPLAGETLRSKTAPSVSELLAKRATQTALVALNARKTKAPNSFYEPMGLANSITYNAAIWDLTRAVPLLKAQWNRNLEYESLETRPYADVGLATNQVHILRFRTKAAREGDAPLEDYARWIEKHPFGYYDVNTYVPLADFDAKPIIKATARKLFGPTQKPFQATFAIPKGQWPNMTRFYALSSPLMKQPDFRALVIRELSNKTVVARLRASSTKRVVVETLIGQGELATAESPNAKLQTGSTVPLRVCDLVGHFLQNKDKNHTPLLDLTRSQTERDRQLPLIRQRVVAGDFYFYQESPK